MSKIYILIGLLFSIIFIVFRRFILSLPKLIYWKIKDILNHDKKSFPYYGCWFFVGKQGSGKTISIVETLERLRKQFPLVTIYTNFGYKYEDGSLTSLTQLLDTSLYNGTYGTIFVIDELQNEFSCSTSRDFPESVLSLITQQRKNHILILCSSQVFTRVSKPLREQCYRAIECSTAFGRYTMCKHYDGIDYADAVERSDDFKREHRPRIQYHSFVQSDHLRECFDSYALIHRMSRVGFVPKLPESSPSVRVSMPDMTVSKKMKSMRK